MIAAISLVPENVFRLYLLTQQKTYNINVLHVVSRKTVGPLQYFFILITLYI